MAESCRRGSTHLLRQIGGRVAAVSFMVMLAAECPAQVPLGFAPNLISPALLPTASSGLVTGDFNGDGIPDLAIIGQQNTVAVLLGTGTGSFTAGSTPAATASNGSAPVRIVAGDFNGDGKLDLATANSNNSLTFLQGNGDGTFSPAGTTTMAGTGAGYTYMLVGDFNGDGKSDIVLSTNSSQASGTAFNSTLLLGNGDGTFTVTTQTLSAIEEGPIAAGDFNGDGKTDLAVASASTTQANGQGGAINVLLSNGDGTFTPGFSQATADTPISIAVGDFEGNGKLDIVAGTLTLPASSDPMGQYGGGSVELIGNGDGTFNALAGSTVDPGAGVFAVADFNGDGKLDLAVSAIEGNPIDGGGNSSIDVELGDGQGGFTPSPASTNFTPFLNGNPLISPNSEQVLAAADFSGDGHAGLAAIGGIGIESGNQVGVLLYPPAITLLPNQLPDAFLGTPYNQTITASGGTPPYTFSANSLPAGLSLSASGVVSGTPTGAGQGFLSLTLHDSNPADPAGSAVYSLNIESPGFSITPASTSATVSPGESATYTLNLASIGGFTSSINLTCSFDPNLDGTCSLSPSTVTLGQSASSVLTVKTTAATTVSSLKTPPATPSRFGGFGSLAGGVSVAGVFLFLWPGRGRSWYRCLCFAIAGLFAAGLVAACGSGNANPMTTTIPGSPAGSYNITVTATPQAAVSTTTTSVTIQTANVQVVVQ